MLTVADFRAIYPAFTVEFFPDTAVNFWLTSATAVLNKRVWGDIYDTATALYVAHNLALNAPTRTLVNGQYLTGQVMPGLATGLAASKQVGGASISYNTEVGQLPEGGSWNLTVWGQEYLTLARSIAVGARQF